MKSQTKQIIIFLFSLFLLIFQMTLTYLNVIIKVYVTVKYN